MSDKTKWYIINTFKPLSFCQGFQESKALYDKAESSIPFTAELRTPNEYVSTTASPDKFTSKEARDYLFSFVFVKTDNLGALDDFLHIPNALFTGRLQNRTTDGHKVLADYVTEEEIDRFFHFCRAYTLYNKDKHIPFIEYTPQTASAGDYAIITKEPYKGARVQVAPDQSRTPQGFITVLMKVLDGVAVSLTIPHENLRMVHPSRYARNKYADYDEFFDAFTDPDVASRLLAGNPTAADVAKALRMRAIVGTVRNEGPRPQRDSRRLCFIKYSALLIIHHILQDYNQFTRILPLWKAMAQTQPPSETTQLIDALAQIPLNHLSQANL